MAGSEHNEFLRDRARLEIALREVKAVRRRYPKDAKLKRVERELAASAESAHAAYLDALIGEAAQHVAVD